jgi:FkbM family methyltransferase
VWILLNCARPKHIDSVFLIMLLFDIGANIGAWAIANRSESNTIISVEASPYTFAELTKKTSIYKNIHALHYAVTSSNEPHVRFFHCGGAHTLSTLNRDWLSSPESRFENYKNTINEIVVPAISIDRLIEIYGVPDLIKIDVEGAENIVLRSLTQKVPLICFEWASEWKTQNFECISYLETLGYTQFAIQYEDNYKYRPSEFNLNALQVNEILNKTKPKQEWGMIWAK